MHRFFVSPTQIMDELITITGSDVHHINRVLRLNPGDRMIVTDGAGTEYLAEIISSSPQSVEAKILERVSSSQEPPVDVFLLQGIPKGEKMELIIQKCTEIGIKKLIPVQMKRTIVKLSSEKEEKRRERWQRVAAEAAKQSQRSVVPPILPISDLVAALRQLPPETTLIMPWEEERQSGLKDYFRSYPQITGPFALLIGPEGGISSEEAELAMEWGAHKVSLGPRILRTETAGFVALSIILYELGDLGGKRNQ
ncbi:16S rRNA (uracil(1498)-N(3))-methyltransferase [Dehalobacterium formicoaceticum]|uniref:Ribosomal RNA small subunit methyltransferase E n=1 Tax=Dehalobacterium formicoaceticum TaxID=51515 RepID=A0ABT1Y248_9FIRM|nr:16S rRNA (uracil(1498)-N(3))-methyltransferase [Dehalobacterium formicoaceticum]MCR6544941.1 16S rRNA (uracil(1498)-N(3))-methyltransferase [Dehalobacterium formicoaceticum]